MHFVVIDTTNNSWTNQKCAGGYPYLVGKHMAEAGVSLLDCQPYAAGNGSITSTIKVENRVQILNL